MSQEVAIPQQLKEQIEGSGINVSRATKIAEKYVPHFSAMQEMAKKLEGLDPTNPEHVEIAKRVRIDLGKECSAVEKLKKADKESILLAQRYIDGLFNTVNGFGRITQQEAKEIEEHQKKLLEEQQAKVASQREAEMRQYLVGDEQQIQDSLDSMKLGEMPEDVHQMLLGSYRSAHEERERKAKEEAERIAAEEAKKKMLAEREKRFLPLQMFASEDDGNFGESTDEEFEAYLAELQSRKDAKAKQEEEERQARVAAEKKAEEERLAREAAEAKAKAEKEAAEKKAAEEAAQAAAKLKAEQEAKAKLEAELAAKKAEEERIAKEAAEKAEAARLAAEEAAKAPIKEQLTKWVTGFELPEAPVSDDPVAEIMQRFDGFQEWALKKISEM